MVLTAIILWSVGMFMCVFGGFFFVVEGEIHREEPFDKYYEQWGVTRFYTLVILAILIAIPFWPLILLGLWITALIKGW
ncbi:hypothetical protein SEA_MOAB_191 [Streptomyces phage Moab]|nr:hypothetical protein SEA_MOAB_191 [Streptomyces phage Moab]